MSDEAAITLAAARRQAAGEQRVRDVYDFPPEGEDEHWVDRMNRSYAMVKLGSGVAIIDFTRTVQGQPAFLTVDAFHAWHQNRSIPLGVTDDGKPKYAPVSRVWIRNPQRREYDAITFDPQLPPGGDGKVFNRFQGFPVAPAPGKCGRFLDHLRTNVARGNAEHARWIFGWWADLFQNPGARPGTALVLTGRQGTGKGFMVRVFARLLGPSYLALSAPGQLTGRFNDHLAGRLLVHLDEAMLINDAAAAGKLRALITEPTLLVEPKNLSAYPEPNFARVVLTGEHEHLVAASLEERRFAVFRVAELAMQNHDYFQEIEDELEAGGYAALMHELLTFDLSTVELRRVPGTEALWRQKIGSMPPMLAWLYARLAEGEMPAGSAWPAEVTKDAPLRVPKRELFDDFRHYTDRSRAFDRADETRFGMFLAEQLPGLRAVKVTNANSVRVNGYQLPGLDQARAAFAERINQPIAWPKPAEDEP